MKTLLISAVLVLAGCVTENTVTEGDRQMSHQNRMAVILAMQLLAPHAAAIPALALVALEDIQKNADQQLKNWGPPKSPQSYSPEASKKAREESQKEHSESWWMTLGKGAVGFLLGGGLVRVLGYTFPKLLGGPVGIAATTLIEAIAKIRKRGEDSPDRKVGVEDILGELSKAQDVEGVRTYVQKLSEKIEKKLGFDFTTKPPQA
ncbi:MAG: hypothetical protein ACREDF_08795 [Thermoplasmata archaeon]